MTAQPCIIIPTRRPPPILTLESYKLPAWAHVLILADPRVLGQHHHYYRGDGPWSVMEGAVGLIPQVLLCYHLCRQMGYQSWIRFDDDLPPKSFIRKDGKYPDLHEVCDRLHLCLEATETSLAGLHNGTNRQWMSKGYGRSYGLIHGGAQICIPSGKPEAFLDPTLRRYEDVYRSLSHRMHAGAVGRVKDIGIDKGKSSNAKNQVTAVDVTQQQRQQSIDLIVQRFPGLIQMDGWHPMTKSNPVMIPHWRFLRGGHYVAKPPLKVTRRA